MKKSEPTLYIATERPRQELETLLASPDENVVNHAFLDAAFYDEDWQWVQSQCLDRLNSPQKQVRAGALYALQILCANRKQIEPQVVLQPVLEMSRDPEVDGIAKDLIEDIYRNFPPQ